MIFSDIDKFFPVVVQKKRIMGIDLGGRRVGIAFSDRNHMIATPYLVYERRNLKKDLGFLNRLFNEKDSTAIVMGFPKFSDSKDQHWIEEIHAFTRKFSKKYLLNIYMQDETFSTKEAVYALRMLPESRIKSMNDKVAASCILQQTLDIMKRFDKVSATI